jgi:S-DNA-T family DNA segregation ATPase FtsK/SpoIIIE
LLAIIIASLIIAFDVHVSELIQRARVWFSGSSGEEAFTEPEVAVTGLTGEDEPEPAHEKVEVHEEEHVRAAPMPREASKPTPQEEGFPILATLDTTYTPPPNSLLARNKGKPEVGDVKANMNIIKRTLQNFGIQVEMDEASIGPTVTRYSMKPAEGVRLSKIVALQSNLELALSASPVRIEAPIPGKSLVGIEVPNIARTTLGLAPLAEEGMLVPTNHLLMSLGRSLPGKRISPTSPGCPTCLVAGTTGSGKSVTIHDTSLFRSSIAVRPRRLRFIMVDPKRVELTQYNSIPHLLTPVITDAKKRFLPQVARQRNGSTVQHSRNRKSARHRLVPRKRIAPALDKVSPKTRTNPSLRQCRTSSLLSTSSQTSCKLSARARKQYRTPRADERAVGIHLILSTQRPSVKVITGLIKANVPAARCSPVASNRLTHNSRHRRCRKITRCGRHALPLP